jgi:hypothetical protein
MVDDTALNLPRGWKLSLQAARNGCPSGANLSFYIKLVNILLMFSKGYSLAKRTPQKINLERKNGK